VTTRYSTQEKIIPPEEVGQVELIEGDDEVFEYVRVILR
jgi:hypothetical protein